MTIHKSKGLEFPVVFLCSCGKKSQNDSCDIVYLSPTAGIVFSPPSPPELRHITGRRTNYFWHKENDETRRRRTAELRRLLYVGMTRAEKELYITGSIDIEIQEHHDFPLCLKKHIEKQCEKNENFIEGDTILDNDTFFGLLLPVIASHIPYSTFFNLEEICHLTEEYVRREEAAFKGSKIKNNKKGLCDFIKNIEPYYKNKEIIKTPLLQDNHLTPVSLKREEDKGDEILGRDFCISKEFSGEKSEDIFERVDALLERFSQKDDYSNERFNSGSFGTIAHICVESRLNGEEPAIPPNISGLITPNEYSTLLEAGNEIASRFIISPLGMIAKKAAFRESEFSFRSIVKNRKGKEIFVNGTIDLFFEDEGVIHIVDFKTDSKESPGEHTAQMTSYYHAISTLFKKKKKKQCRVWLYYLRSGHAVEMTEKTGQFHLEQRAFS
jgi:ATP-dependent helicase/nuclease subunit A